MHSGVGDTDFVIPESMCALGINYSEPVQVDHEVFDVPLGAPRKVFQYRVVGSLIPRIYVIASPRLL